MDTEVIRLNDNEAGAILITGPTASGKSTFAIQLANVVGGTIINADSMQVYGDLAILTARPCKEDELAVPHRLYGHVDAADVYSVGRWLEDVAAQIALVTAEGSLPIVVGGTGLYFKTLLEGLVEIPEISEDIRSYWRQRGAADSPGELHEALAERDPEMASRLPSNDRQRIVRALEVFAQTGRSLSHWQNQATEPVIKPGSVKRFVLAPPRDILHQRIETRFAQMVANGAIDEVAALTDRRLDPVLPAMKAIGVRPLAAYLAGEFDLETAIERSIIETRQYAKRQMTWFRGQMADWDWREQP